jgi:hypothetical protein
MVSLSPVICELGRSSPWCSPFDRSWLKATGNRAAGSKLKYACANCRHFLSSATLDGAVMWTKISVVRSLIAVEHPQNLRLEMMG